MTAHDKRLSAFRSDLADARLAGQVQAERFVDGHASHIAVPVSDVLTAPRAGAGLSTQLLLGTQVTVFDEADCFAWVQGNRDGYVGYVKSSDLAAEDGTPTHRVIAPRSFLYSGPDLRLPRSGALSMGSEVEITAYAETRGTQYAILRGGEAVIAAHLAGLGAQAADYVSVAETLISTPYLWGGASAFGIDCSGLVQLSMRMAGSDAPRDSDMQAAGLGEPIDAGAEFSRLQRGDLAFWKGHVGIMTDAETMIHASGHTMLVSREKLDDAINRIGYLYGGPTGFRRP